MKLFFFGATEFSKPVFEALKEAWYFPILWKTQNINKEEFKEFRKLAPDICIVAAYGKIIPKEWLTVPKYGFLNVHPSLLPKYRGAAPIQTAILDGIKETGVTIILMDEKADHGRIVSSIKYKVSSMENYKSLEEKLADLGAQLLIKTLPKWIKGEIKPKEQNHAEASYTKKFSRPDGKIDWHKTAKKVDRQIRALSGEPGTWTIWNGKILKILEARIYEKQPRHERDKTYIGIVYEENNQVFIPCAQGHIELLKVQLEGKKPMPVRDFLNGHRDFVGSVLQ